MATTFRVEDQYSERPPEKKKSMLTGCLLGCLVVGIVVLLLGGIAAFYVARHAKEWGSSVVAQGLKQSINASDLPPQEKIEVNAEIDRGAKAVADGRMSMEQVGKMMQMLSESPLMTAIIASAADTKYIKKSGLSDEEKTEANVTIQRFARGMIDKKISEQTSESVMSQIATKQGNNNWRFKDNVTDDELKKFLADAKKAADDAGVEANPVQVDPSDEMKRIIDDAMQGGGPAIEAPPMEAPPATEPPAEPAGKT